jgi:predicted lipid-binding transport protein (Tim44 family)
MRILSVFLTALLAVSAFTISDAEAKRFGGGMSMGKKYSMPRSAQKPAAQTPAAGTRQQAAANPARGGGASRWLGPLAGLAAGGLLASLFFGDAFEGFQMFDFLIIAALVFGGVMLFRMMRRGSGASPAAAGAGGYGGGSFPPAPRSGDGVMPPDLGGAAPAAMAGEDEAPVWFDGPAFVEGAKTHFIRLQAAWDQADFRDIREYTTPQLFAELQRERQRLGEAHQFTEVVTLDAELAGVRRDGGVAVASIAFSGLIREEESGTANQFHEVWHVQHAWDNREGDWLIAGIQQVEGQ